MDYLGRPGQQDRRVQQDPLVTKGIQVLLDQVDHLARPELDCRDRLVPLGILATQVPVETQVHQVKPVSKDQQAALVLWAPLVLRVTLGLWEQRDRQA